MKKIILIMALVILGGWALAPTNQETHIVKAVDSHTVIDEQGNIYVIDDKIVCKYDRIMIEVNSNNEVISWQYINE